RERQHLGQELRSPRGGARADDLAHLIPPCCRLNSWSWRPSSLMNPSAARWSKRSSTPYVLRAWLYKPCGAFRPTTRIEPLKSLSTTSPVTTDESESLKAWMASRSGEHQKPSQVIS